jgi:valyl-tRNA synthetase
MLPDGPYKPAEYEKEILDFWLENKFYKPEFDPAVDRVKSIEEMKSDIRESWALICPPPNAYARPHIGNISGYAYQDAMARYARMKGKKVLVLPGKDHAGLEGEGVFVREVLEKQGRNKFDMKREDFYKEMMDFFMKNIDIAAQDERGIGLSADFDRDTFTLDPAIVEIVLDTFVEMYKDGRIYKGVRIINWDPKARTAVADNQIEYKESVTPFFYFKYAFTEPEEGALELKRKYAGQNIEWEFERSKTKDGEEDLTFHFGKANGVEIMGYGYTDNIENGTKLKGKVIGIQMKLDKKFRLIVLNEGSEIDIKSALHKSFIFEAKYYAGAHHILFEEYPEEKFYTNGFVIGTVRPETIFADTAIACDPKDNRYKEFVGKKIEVEFLGEKKELNFIEDFAVDKDFGTGLLKVTPAHASEDWEIAGRHPDECLPAIQVIGYDLRLNKLTGKYNGMGIKEARKQMQQDMKEYGNLIYVDEKYENKIKIAERTKAPIEPLLSSQWYLKYDGLKEAAQEMVETGEVKLHPDNMNQKFNHWMNNLRDWAISRSLWWGYRLPVWYAGKVTEEIDENGQVKEFIEIDGAKVELDYSNPNHLRVQKENPGEGWVQDENVLDTWFSSGQWVYATLTKYNLMDTFFPTDVLVSASDILENWDSRMMMFTYFKHKKIPFKNLFLTGLVLGSDGQKMSKSRGNIIDIDKIKAEYGSDALRMAYFYQNTAGGSYVISPDKLKNFKQFNNKLWNASRFVLNSIGEPTTYQLQPTTLKLELSNKIISHITELKEHITRNIDNFQFGLATYNLYHNFWTEFCDIYIEESKKHLNVFKDKETGKIISEPTAEEKEEMSRVMVYTLKEYLKMLHPFIPFITEKIWQEIPKEKGDFRSLLYTNW